jgi:hypothetical protein
MPYNLRSSSAKEVQKRNTILEDVKKDGLLLKDIKNQTPEICLAAVSNYGHALKFVHKQTLEICLAAIKQNEYAVHHVDKKILLEIYKEKIHKEGQPVRRSERIAAKKTSNKFGNEFQYDPETLEYIRVKY